MTKDVYDSVPDELADLLNDLKKAINFFKKVEASSKTEKIAVGNDHYVWMKKSAFRLADKWKFRDM